MKSTQKKTYVKGVKSFITCGPFIRSCFNRTLSNIKNIINIFIHCKNAEIAKSNLGYTNHEMALLYCKNVKMQVMLQRPNPLLRDVRHVEEHGSTFGIRIQMPGSSCLQKVDPDEHAVGQRGQGELHDDLVLVDP